MTRPSLTVVPLAVLFACSMASAQPTPMGQTLLRRIAEAVDGNRGTEPVFIVANTRPPYQVGGVRSALPSAQDLAGRLGPNFSVFGPYLSDIPDPGGPIGCVHDHRGSNMRGLGGSPMPAPEADSTRGGICPLPVRPGAAVTRITLNVEYSSGPPHVVEIDSTIDAVFLRVAAIDKFVVPYYQRVLGLERTRDLRRRLIGNVP